MAVFRSLRLMFRPDVLGRIMVALVFLISAVAKMRSTQEFEATLVKSELVSSAYAVMTAYAIIAAEFILVIGLLVPRFLRQAALASTMLVSGYLSYSLWRWSQGITVPCSCFGTIYKFSPSQMALVNMVLLGILVPILRATSSSDPTSITDAKDKPVVDATNV